MRYSKGMRRRTATFSLGAVLAAIVTFLTFCKWLVDWLSRIDFVISRQADPGWLGSVARLIMQMPAMLAGIPQWAFFLAALTILIAGLIYIDFKNRRLATTFTETMRIASQEEEPERDKHDRIAKWLINACSTRGLQIKTAALFGSVVHDHYATSDVDLLIIFHILSERRIAKTVKEIKGKMAKEFYSTFGHSLHVTFFCHSEIDDLDNFFACAGKHEIIVDRR